MEFPPRENKNKTFCCVYGCNSKFSKNNTVRFYTFPSANSNFVVMKIGNEVTQSKKVFSLHFTKNDFIPTYNQCCDIAPTISCGGSFKREVWRQNAIILYSLSQLVSDCCRPHFIRCPASSISSPPIKFL